MGLWGQIVAPIMLSVFAFSSLLMASLQPFLERPQIDFDFVIDALKDRGSWVEVEADAGEYYFLPDPGWQEKLPPYRHGQWHYTDYGWTWRGADPESWMMDHYGYWTRLLDSEKRWTWVPGIHWLSATVEWLESGDYYGWRASHLDRFSNMVERESVRYGSPEEWNFVLKEKVAGPLEPSDFADVEKTAELMANAVPVDHVYTSYREIGRPGPDPTILTGDPETLPGIPVTLSLPDLRFKPKQVEPDQYFVYRPDFYQDAGGIQRRIHLFVNPRATPDEAKLKEIFGETEEQKQKREEAVERMEERLQKEREFMERLYE